MDKKRSRLLQLKHAPGRMKQTFLLAAGVLASCLAFSQTPHTLLWQISGKGMEKPSYLFGTMHVLCADDAKLSDSLRFAIGRNKAIAFGLRGRTYNHVKTSTFTTYDSITSFSGFLHANTNTDYLSGFATHAGWIEGDINYSQVWIDDARHRVSGGITLGIMRGLSGAFSQLNKLTYREYPDAQNNYYQIITGGTATAEYSGLPWRQEWPDQPLPLDTGSCRKS